jgi:hypothetical protein
VRYEEKENEEHIEAEIRYAITKEENKLDEISWWYFIKN